MPEYLSNGFLVGPSWFVICFTNVMIITLLVESLWSICLNLLMVAWEYFLLFLKFDKCLFIALEFYDLKNHFHVHYYIFNNIIQILGGSIWQVERQFSFWHHSINKTVAELLWYLLLLPFAFMRCFIGNLRMELISIFLYHP